MHHNVVWDCGRDGIIIKGTSDTTVGHQDKDGGSTGTLEGFWGACIVYGSNATASAAR